MVWSRGCIPYLLQAALQKPTKFARRGPVTSPRPVGHRPPLAYLDKKHEQRVLAELGDWREERLLDEAGEEIFVRYNGDPSKERYEFIRDYLDFKVKRMK